MKHAYVPSGVPFLRSQNVRPNRFDPAGLLHISPDFHRRLKKSTLLPGDLVVVRSGSVGVTCVVPVALGEANCADLVIIQRPKGIVPEYGAYYMTPSPSRMYAQGGLGSRWHISTRLQSRPCMYQYRLFLNNAE
jgi:type I restriction enzyme S subunit